MKKNIAIANFIVAGVLLLGLLLRLGRVRGGPDQSRRRQCGRADELPAIHALAAHGLSPPLNRISFRAEISFSFCSFVPTLIRSLSWIPGAFQYRTKIFRWASNS